MQAEDDAPAKRGAGERAEAPRRQKSLAVGALLPAVAGRALAKRGLAEGRLLADWPTLIGAEIARHAAPERLSFPPGRREGGTLHLVVDGPWAVELQHLAPQLVERINGYFGYRAVARLKMRRGTLPTAATPDARVEPDAPTRARIEREAASVHDPGLRRALVEFGATLEGRRAVKRRE
jgi:hypothetical protein